MSGPRYGFIPAPGKNFSVGSEPTIAQRLDALAVGEHLTIYGISGYRTPAQSAALPGGSANDPHTQGRAADIGVNGQTRASAAQLSEKTLNKYGLTRPFGGASEVNHVQLLPGWTSGLHVDPAYAAAHPNAYPAVTPDTSPTFGDPIGTVAGVPGDIAAKIVKALADALGLHASRIMLYVVLIGGGAALAVAGFARTAGVTPGDAVKAAVAVPK